MAEDVIDRYISLTKKFIDGEINADLFKNEYFSLFKSVMKKQDHYLTVINKPPGVFFGEEYPYPEDRTVWLPQGGEEIVGSLFCDVDSYSPTPDPNYDQINSDELKTFVEAAYQKLLSLKDMN